MSLTRVRYRDGQTLRATDLLAERGHRSEQRRRHAIAQHGWGIVAGLSVHETVAGFAVAPGVAIDGYGRELVLIGELAVPQADIEEIGGACVAIWLLHCPMPDRASGPRSNRGVRDEPRIFLTGCGGSVRAPEEVSPIDVDFPPHLPLPADQLWPVYLGNVTSAEDGWHVEEPDWDRPYASLNGWSMATPPGTARMRIGNESATDRTRFAVAIPDLTREWVDHLAVDASGLTTVVGDVRLADVDHPSDLVIDATGATTPIGLGFTTPVETPEVAQPWRIYRTTVEEDGEQIDELRIEILDPGKAGDPRRDLFAIGHHEETTFVPCLTVSADCTVTIAHDLTVMGSITQAPTPLDAAVTGETGENLVQVTPTDVGALGVTITPTGSFDVGDDLTFSVTVTNERDTPVIPVVVYSTVTANGVSIPATKVGEHSLLGVNGSAEGTVTFSGILAISNAAVGAVDIAVSASGVSLGPVIAFGTATWSGLIN